VNPVTPRLTDTLESFTIAQAAERWAEDTGERADLIERKLIQAAYGASSDPNSEDVELRFCMEPSNAKYDGLSVTERAHATRAVEKELYSKIDGLYVTHRGEPITPATTVRRTALEVWCEREGFELPQFLKPRAGELELRVRTWLRDCIKSEQQLGVRKTKADYRASAIDEFGPELSKRAFDRVWDSMVPDAWRCGGRPKKPKHL
jgi:hypothetical protein